MPLSKEILAERALQDEGFPVHNANIVFRSNCPNIDLVVYSKTGAVYVQVKSSANPANKNHVLVDGSPWTEEQLNDGAPLYNKHDDFQARFVVIVDTAGDAGPVFYIAPPDELEKLAREGGRQYADRPKRDGSRRSIRFRKELPRELLNRWRSAWHLLGEPPQRP